MARAEEFSVENARIIFPNFSGREKQFNPPGKRMFTLELDDPNLVQMLEEDGWNVKHPAPKNEDDPMPLPRLDVEVKYSEKARPPKAVIISSHGKQQIGENEIGMLDWAEIKNVDVIIRPYNYSVNGRQGVKAYLKAIYVTIAEDRFEEKYADYPFE